MSIVAAAAAASRTTTTTVTTTTTTATVTTKMTNRTSNSNSSNSRIVRLGGPGTWLPRPVESFLSWSLALGCLAVSGYYYLRHKLAVVWLFRYHHCYSVAVAAAAAATAAVTTTTTTITTTQKGGLLSLSSSTLLLPPLPQLMTHSRQELERNGWRQRWMQLERLLLVLQQQHQYEPTTQHGNDNPHHDDNNDNDNDDHRQKKKKNNVAASAGNIDPSSVDQSVWPLGGVQPFGDDNNNTNDDDESLIALIRSNDLVRRLVSLVMLLSTSSSSSSNNNDDDQNLWGGFLQPRSSSTSAGGGGSTTSPHTNDTNNTNVVVHEKSRLVQLQRRRLRQLRRIWPRIYQLPLTAPTLAAATSRFSTVATVPGTQPLAIAISLVVPCYRENMHHVVHHTLAHAAAVCRALATIQLILVQADDDNEKDSSTSNTSSLSSSSLSSDTVLIQNELAHQGWGAVQVLSFSDGTGRGPCLNHGATYATGDIVSFLHSDTKLPTNWDVAVVQTLLFGPMTTKTTTMADRRSSSSSSSSGPDIVACAFAFGIDTGIAAPAATGGSSETFGSVGDPTQQQQQPPSPPLLPPGLRAIEVTANLRCQLWSLPYGDQCLSLRRSDFEYVGGFPHQCIMEDYELVVLLRERGMVRTLSRPYTALCSPRRWHQYGVLFVTYTNSYLVRQYKSGVMSPADIYNQYYGNSNGVPMKVDDQSPWEERLEKTLLLTM